MFADWTSGVYRGGLTCLGLRFYRVPVRHCRFLTGLLVGRQTSTLTGRERTWEIRTDGP